MSLDVRRQLYRTFLIIISKKVYMRVYIYISLSLSLSLSPYVDWDVVGLGLFIGWKHGLLDGPQPPFPSLGRVGSLDSYADMISDGYMGPHQGTPHNEPFDAAIGRQSAQVITTEIDEGLDGNGTVLPGIGNFGDRYFGSWAALKLLRARRAGT